MDTPILQTKLHAPPSRDGVVARRRLADRLSLGSRSKLTLVSAPPGSGKSTLVGDWVATRDAGAVAWLSLDLEDNDPATFWTYVIAALETAAPDVGTSARAALDSDPPQTELALRILLNDLATLTCDVVLVLDDYHVVERPEVHEAVAFLLDHLPPRVHVIVVTRADPALPLSRLRVRGELLEIRAKELRFTGDEAEAYLNGAMGLGLTGADVAALEARTEGWIAGLQLAALSMQGRDDVASFVASFAGDDRYLLDYLVDEVLARQREDVRDFLLHTAVLERLTGSLCDAVTGRHDGKAVLEALDRANLFLVALDDQRHWFRYHHMFRDVLRARLLDAQPQVVPTLHRHASDWFAEHGERAEAIRHALSAGELERAADLMELAVSDLRKARHERTWLRWVDALPTELLLARPVLSVASAGVLLSAGNLERVEELLQAAERWIAMPERERSSAGMVALDSRELGRLPSAIALYRTAQARMRDDIPGTIAHAHRALELATEDDLVGRGGAAAFLGLAHWATGDLDTAYRWYTDGMASMERAGHLADTVAGAVTQADIRLGQGRLAEALSVLERGLAVATGSRPTPLRGAPDMHVAIADILRERDDLAGARRHLDEARGLGEEYSYRQYPYRTRVVMARIRQAEGDPAGAIQLLDEAEAAYVGEFSPDVRPIAALKARVWIAEGDLQRAWAWAGEHDLSTADALTYVHEFEHATLARLLVAQGNRDASRDTLREAIQFAQRLVVSAEAGSRNGSVLDALVVLALARHAAGDDAGAIAALGRAAALAEPEGHLRVFLDEGSPMTILVKAATRQPTAPDAVRRLHTAALQTRDRTAAQPLIEPLSERELEVLHLLRTELDGPAIARELVVSLSTVRTHTQSIYAKLGVNNRRSAVRRAEDLDLLSGTRR